MTCPSSPSSNRSRPATSGSCAAATAAVTSGEPAHQVNPVANKESSGSRVVYGRGAIKRLPAELGALRVSHPLIVSSPSRVATARHIQSIIPNLSSHILDSAVITVPDHVIDDAVARISGRDVVISVGGSSAVGLARAISIRKGIPHICIPTTYSSVEITPLYEHDAATVAGRARRGSFASTKKSNSSKHSSGRTTTGSKNSSKQSLTIRDAKSRVKPAVIIYDEDLTQITVRRILAPSIDHHRTSDPPSSSQPNSSSSSSEWSYLQLPGI